MTVGRCYICAKDPLAARRYGDPGLENGHDCPICYQPTCRYHLTVVRWRWRETGELDSALVCHECKRTYAHRDWDAANKEWIT